MNAILMVVSAISFISAFGIHMFAKNEARYDFSSWCGYMDVPWMSAIPWVSGFVLAVIPEALLFKLFWVWMFLINLVVVFVLGPLLARMFLKRFATGKSAGYDIIVAMVLGTVALVIGIALMD